MSTTPLEVTDVIGSFGPWQRRIFVMCMQRGFFTAMHTLAIPLLATRVRFFCNDGINNGTYFKNSSSDIHSQCQSPTDPETNVSMPCTQWEYDSSEYKSTIITEWGLVCDRAWMVSLCQTTYMVSLLISVFLFGLLSDRIGRRPVLLAGSLLFVFGAVATIFSPSFLWFNIFRVVLAAGAAALQNTAYCNLMENIGMEHRMRVGIAFSYGWMSGLMVMAGVGYLLPNWRYLQAAIGVPTVSLLIFFCLMPESPRWLLTQRRDSDARGVLEGAMKVNKIKVDNMDATMEGLKAKIQKGEHDDAPSILELFRTPRLRTNSFAIFFAFFVVSFLYYALSLGIADLGGNPHLNFFISAAIEIPCYPLAYLGMRFTTRRNTTSAFFAASGILCLATLLAPKAADGSSPWLLIALSTLGKMFISSAFFLSMILSGECFPTVLRTVGVSSSWVFARIASAIVPFVSELGKITAPYVPFMIFGALALCASGVLLLLPPDMQSSNLADTVKEAETSKKIKPIEMGHVNKACDVDDVKPK